MRICVFGDSFVNGTGDDDCLGWPGRLCAEARRRGRDVTLYNLGIRRDTSGDISERWEREAAARLAPEHDGRLIFSFRGQSTGEAALDARVARMSERMELACREVSVPFLPVFPILAGHAVWRDEAARGDGTHPNRGGYAAIAEAVLAWRPWRDWVGL